MIVDAIVGGNLDVWLVYSSADQVEQLTSQAMFSCIEMKVGTHL